jgi:hypothetical protein
VAINDFNLLRIAGLELKTHAPTVIDADASLPLQLAQQSVKTVRRRLAQVRHINCSVQLGQLHHRATQGIRRQAPRLPRQKQTLGFRVGKAFNLV